MIPNSPSIKWTLSLVICFFLLVSFSCRKADDSGWGKVGVNGKVMEIVERTYQVKEGNGELQPDKSREIAHSDIEFDSSGNLVTEMHSNLQVFFNDSYYHKHSNNLSHISRRGPMYDERDTIFYTNGRQDSIITINQQNGRRISTEKLVLDVAGNVIRRTKRDSSGKITEIVKIEYKDNREVREIVTDGQGVKQREKLNSWNGSRETAFTIRQVNQPDRSFRLEYTAFDKADNWTTKIAYQADGKPSFISFRFYKYQGQRSH